MSKKRDLEYDVIVVGAGHAGCEAALAAARLGCRTLLLTLSLDKIALMPCNPAIGGIGKGHLVKEIDALGGEMGKNTDETFVQIKVLNKKKGPAVQALRAQADKKNYENRMKKVLQNEPNLHLKQAIVVALGKRGGKITGIKTKTGLFYEGKTVILTTGTFLRGRVVLGETSFPAGRMGEFPAQELSLNLRELGLELGRFQSATPPRVDKRSLNFSRLKVEAGEEEPIFFSFDKEPEKKEQLPCYLTYTNKETHRAVKKYLHLSPIKTGTIQSHGPRYCPSIDRKVINFPEKEHHPVFIEPEGWETQEMYLQGLTTAMPVRAQTEIVRSTPGLKSAEIMRPGYAVEYDYLPPHQLKATLETKVIENLFAAGQINGTTGYEEAAAQGLIAGVNAALKVKGKAPFILDRSQAYIGVLIDDLVTKGVDEPYRIFTSRAEYRLLLRTDNADLRLTPLGFKLGLVGQEKYRKVQEKRGKILRANQKLANTILSPTAKLNQNLRKVGSAFLQKPISFKDLLRRPEITLFPLKEFLDFGGGFQKEIFSALEAEVKYEGYIKRQEEEVIKYKRLEEKRLPKNLNYLELKSLSFEAREKLSRVLPSSLGQASRIPGVTPADISILMVYLEQKTRVAF